MNRILGRFLQDWRKAMASELEERNKPLVLSAFDALFNERDYATAERFWLPQWCAHVRKDFPKYK